MELKNYQKDVISDLSRFLTHLNALHDISKAYEALWYDKSVSVGAGGMPPYRVNIPNVPEVCFKVPTGGGKTFIAACSLKHIFDSMPAMRTKAVVWLVPSEAILSQTYKALSSPSHDYRRRIDNDFSGRVEVYSKEQLLNGQNFNPTAVTEQLSIFVLSYDSFRTSKKDGRKAYQENGNLATFPALLPDKSVLLPDTDETALIQVIRALNPVVIVDESHHATSNLSVEMLRNFNPCFVLDLTATPKENSNIISFVDAARLKKENMVKLPVIVYNRKSQTDVYMDAISMRQKLEEQAKIERETTGRYIRPIVLFQAQPRIGSDSTTYDKIKDKLIEAGIPAAHIAIKTGDKDELRGVDLMSPECEIRYIITVNALKEGWDCPFAYILATVANRSSVVDVEQILGRILRMPYAQRKQSDILNISYVITSSADFHQTVENVIKGLNSAGFSRHDCRVKDEPEAETNKHTQRPSYEQGAFTESTPKHGAEHTPEPEQDDLPDIDTGALKDLVEAVTQKDSVPRTEDIESDELFADAIAQSAAYEQDISSQEDTPYTRAPQEVRDKMKVFRINSRFAEEIEALKLPQFTMDIPQSIFTSDQVLVTPISLTKGFILSDKDTQIDFSTVAAEMARIDVDENSGSTEPKAWKVTGREYDLLQEYLNARPSEARLEACKKAILDYLSKYNELKAREIPQYVDRIIAGLSEDQISEMEKVPYLYAQKIKEKIEALLAVYRESRFSLLIEQGKITCTPWYLFPSMISPTTSISSIPKSLYEAEEDMDEYERKVVWDLSALDNIRWWHRNISRSGFCINGYFNSYPDIIARTESGKILIIEPKGDHLENAESRAKAIIGSKWDSLAGPQYRYFMVFQTKSPDYPGAYSFKRFMEIVRDI